MPRLFNKCVARGGKIRTKKLSGERYQPICYLDGKAYPGEIHTKAKKRKKK